LTQHDQPLEGGPFECLDTLICFASNGKQNEQAAYWTNT